MSVNDRETSQEPAGSLLTFAITQDELVVLAEHHFDYVCELEYDWRAFGQSASEAQCHAKTRLSAIRELLGERAVSAGLARLHHKWALVFTDLTERAQTRGEDNKHDVLPWDP